MNQVILYGLAGKDAISGQTKTGSKWSKVSLATSTTPKVTGDKVNDFAANKRMNTEWHNVVAWGKVSERLSEVKKGDSVFIIGKILSSKYIKDGKTISTTNINAQKIVLTKNPKAALPPDFDESEEMPW